MDPATLVPLIWTAAVAIGGAILTGLAWIGKSILQPWSETYRMKVVADAEHLRNVDSALVLMVAESRKQTGSLESIDGACQEQAALLTKMDSDQKRICKADLQQAAIEKFGITSERFELLIEQNKKIADGVAALNEHATKAATELKKENVEGLVSGKTILEKIEVIHKQTNSIKDELVKVTGEAEHAKGVIEGKRLSEQNEK